MSVQRVKVAEGIWRRQLADGGIRYEIAYRDSDGRQRRQVVEGGFKAAKTALSAVKADMGKGKRVAPNPRLTFGDAAEGYLATLAGSDLRPATVATYTTAVTVHLVPAWGRERLDKIDLARVLGLIQTMRTPSYRAKVEQRLGKPSSGSGGYAPWAVRGVLVAAGRVFEYARRERDWTGDNPVRQLDRGDRPRLGRKERRILGREELERLIAAAEPPYRQIIATAASLGTRLGETLGLTWADVDLDEGTVSIVAQIDRHGRRVDLKTERSRRVVEAPGSLLAVLREHKLASAYSRPSDLVFTTRTGAPLDHRAVARIGLQRAYKRAGLDGRCPTMHELRHGHASAWIASGGDLVELSSRLGHRDPAVTASVYSHEFEAQARSAERRARLDSLYGGESVDPNVASGDVVALPKR